MANKYPKVDWSPNPDETVTESDSEDLLEEQHHTALYEAITALAAYEAEEVSGDLVIRATELLQRLVAGNHIVPKDCFAVPNGQIAIDPQKVGLIFTDGAGGLTYVDCVQPHTMLPRSRAIAAGLVELAWENFVQPKRVIAGGDSKCGTVCSFNSANVCVLPPHSIGTQHAGPQGTWF